MTFISRVRSVLSAAAGGAAEPQVLREAMGVTIDDDEGEWRRLTGQTKRDLSPLTQARMRELAVYLWETNPLANRLIELPIAFLLAEGVKLTVQDDEAQKWLDAFWRDPINKMALKLAKKMREMALFGEQCWPVFVNEMSGEVRLGYLDPGLIETVVVDPGNAEQPIGIVTVKNKRGHARRYRIIVNGPESVFSKQARGIRETFTDGDCFYYTINALSNGRRGRSDLLANIDWLDGYDQFLFGELDRTKFLRAFVWDVELMGMTPDEVEARAHKITVPKPGSVRVHNDAEKWTAVAPKLQSADSEAGARLFRNHILGGATIPEHWFGGGGDVNRATAGEMGEPAFKMLAFRQWLWKQILQDIGVYVIARRMDPTGDAAFELVTQDPDHMPEAVFPELTARDTSKYATAMQQVVAAVVLAIDRELLTQELGLRLINAVAGRLGVEFDAAEELERVRDETDERNERDRIVVPEDDGDGDPAAGGAGEE